MKVKRSNWPAVILLCFTATSAYICRVNISTAGALLMKEFNLSQAAMGRIFSAFLLGYAFFQMPAGALADRWGARRILRFSACCWAVLTAAQALIGRAPLAAASSAIAALMALRFLLGISEAPTYPGAAQGVARWVLPHHQGRANGIVIASVGLGSALTPPLVSGVMVRWGWRAALLISALPALAAALVWLKVPEPPSTGRAAAAGAAPAQSGAGARGGGLRSPGFLLLTASYTLQGYVGYIFVSWFYLYLVQERQFDLLRGAWMSSLAWLLSIVSIPLGGWISDRLVLSRLGYAWGRRLVPVSGMALSGLFISVGAHTADPVTAALALALATALVLCVEGPFWATMMSIAGAQSGKAGGLMNMGCNIGGLVSPALTPLLAQHIGWENALHVAAGLAVLAAALWLGIRAHPDPSAGEPPPRRLQEPAGSE